MIEMISKDDHLHTRQYCFLYFSISKVYFISIFLQTDIEGKRTNFNNKVNLAVNIKNIYKMKLINLFQMKKNPKCLNKSVFYFC